MASVLPVTYTSVKARKHQDDVLVEWKVENQLNIKKYEVERSVDGRNFVKAYTIAATNTNAYNWLDENSFSGANFYRIRNVDKDGSYQYSQIVKVNMDRNTSGFNIYPNPVTNNNIGLQINNLPAGNYNLRLISMAGQVMTEQQVSLSGGTATQSIKIDKLLSSGIYKLEITDAANNTTVLNVQVK